MIRRPPRSTQWSGRRQRQMCIRDSSKRARLVTSAYPIIQQFPWLLILMIICVIIAVWRYLEITRTQEKSLNTQRKAAKQRQHRDEAAVESSSQVRRRLAESDRRVASRTQERPASRRPAADIIRDAEARRQARQQAARSRQETSRSGARPAASASSASRNAEQLRERPCLLYTSDAADDLTTV